MDVKFEKCLPRYKAYRKRKIRRILSLVAVLAIISIVLAGIINYAAAKNPNNYEIEYVTVCVHRGDTLWDLSREYMGDYPGSIYEYMHDICVENDIENGNYIRFGDAITFKKYHRK